MRSGEPDAAPGWHRPRPDRQRRLQRDRGQLPLQERQRRRTQRVAQLRGGRGDQFLRDGDRGRERSSARRRFARRPDRREAGFEPDHSPVRPGANRRLRNRDRLPVEGDRRPGLLRNPDEGVVLATRCDGAGPARRDGDLPASAADDAPEGGDARNGVSGAVGLVLPLPPVAVRRGHQRAHDDAGILRLQGARSVLGRHAAVVRQAGQHVRRRRSGRDREVGLGQELAPARRDGARRRQDPARRGGRLEGRRRDRRHHDGLSARALGSPDDQDHRPGGPQGNHADHGAELHAQRLDVRRGKRGQRRARPARPRHRTPGWTTGPPSRC